MGDYGLLDGFFFPCILLTMAYGLISESGCGILSTNGFDDMMLLAAPIY